jgi:hypothetical protein
LPFSENKAELRSAEIPETKLASSVSPHFH